MPLIGATSPRDCSRRRLARPGEDVQEGLPLFGADPPGVGQILDLRPAVLDDPVLAGVVGMPGDQFRRLHQPLTPRGSVW